MLFVQLVGPIAKDCKGSDQGSVWNKAGKSNLNTEPFRIDATRAQQGEVRVEMLDPVIFAFEASSAHFILNHLGVGQDLPNSFSFAGTGIAGSTGPAQLYWHTNVYAISGSVTKIVGRDTSKAVGLVRSVQWIADPDSGGVVFGITAQATASPLIKGTGQSVASALLGIPNNTTAQAIGGSRAFFHNYGFFFTDNYQATKNLTLDLGLRWDQPGSYSEANNWSTVILPNEPPWARSQILLSAPHRISSETWHWWQLQPTPHDERKHCTGTCSRRESVLHTD